VSYCEPFRLHRNHTPTRSASVLFRKATLVLSPNVNAKTHNVDIMLGCPKEDGLARLREYLLNQVANKCHNERRVGCAEIQDGTVPMHVEAFSKLWVDAPNATIYAYGNATLAARARVSVAKMCREEEEVAL
jgi:hypothetical protein